MWWFEVICTFWEGKRESVRLFTHAVCEIKFHRISSNYFDLFTKEIWIVPQLKHHNYFIHAGPLTASTLSAWDQLMRKLIGSWSIRAPLVEKVIQKHTSTHKLTTSQIPETPPELETPFYILPQLSLNQTHRIVGYHRQWRIHLCRLQQMNVSQ